MQADQVMKTPPIPTTESADSNDSVEAALAEQISHDSFDDWYKQREYQQNILEGKPYFNEPKEPKPSHYHTPSKLLKCHRKTTYDKLAAPKEEPDPTGIFWIGSNIEEKLVLPYLQNLVRDSDIFVTNSLWIDITTTPSEYELEIRGATDPVLVDEHGIPILPTEVKSRKSVENQDSPSQHHRAQTHAYMEGLSRKYDRDIRNAVIIYVARNTLNLNTFYIQFDQEFWESTVLQWAEKQTAFRDENDLPPATPMNEWECNYCDFKQRCGKGDREYADTLPNGFLPLYVYPREMVTEYIEAHSEAKLTPTLAHYYPDLAAEYPVHDWVCSHCSTAYHWQNIDWEGDTMSAPLCPNCADRNDLHRLTAPTLNQKKTGWTDITKNTSAGTNTTGT